MSTEHAMEDYLNSDPELVVKMIVPLRVVGNGGIVTKIKGEKRYEVFRTIRIFTEGEKKAQKMEAPKGMVWLAPADESTTGSLDMNTLHEDTEVVWHVSVNDIAFAMGKAYGY